MTERKRPDVTFVNWVEQQIRAAQERGEFDNLPGAGKPIPDHGDDELWWIRSYLAREGLSGEALLPRELQLRREVERLPETIGTAPHERAVREIVADLNRRIVDCLRTPGGLPVPIRKVDADATVRIWKLERERRRAEARKALNSTLPRFDSEIEPRTEGAWRRALRRLLRRPVRTTSAAHPSQHGPDLR